MGRPDRKRCNELVLDGGGGVDSCGSEDAFGFGGELAGGVELEVFQEGLGAAWGEGYLF